MREDLWGDIMKEEIYGDIMEALSSFMDATRSVFIDTHGGGGGGSI